MLKKMLPLVLCGLLGAGGAGAVALATRTLAPISAANTAPGAKTTPPAPLDLRVKWWVENGQIKTSVDPVTNDQ